MFRWLNKQGVASDSGFVVQSIDRFTIEYREGTKKVSVEVENGFLGEKPCVSILPSAFERWDGDPHNEEIPSQRQAEMHANFRAAMEFQRLAVVVEAEASG